MFFFGKETKSANIGMWNLTISKKKKKKKKQRKRKKKRNQIFPTKPKKTETTAA